MLLGPNYTKPRINIPEKWAHETNFKINDTLNLPDMIWWKQFHSSELDTLIQKALKQNNNLNIAIAKIDYAQNQLKEVKLNWLPGMSLLAGYSQFPVLGYPGAFFIAAPVYVLNVFQQYKQQKSAHAIVQASIYAKDSVRLVVIAQVSASFFSLIAQQEALVLYNQLLNEYRTHLKLAKSNYLLDLTAYDDIDQLESQIAQVKSQIDLVKNNIAMSKNTLHFLLNENPGDIVANTSFKHINSSALIPGDLPLTVLNNRPDVREAEALLRASNADIGAVAANLLPSITLGAYLGKGSSITGPINLLESYLNVPIANFPVFAQINERRAQYKIACISYMDTIRRALRDVDNDLSAYVAYSNQYQNNSSALMHEKRHCHLVDVRYKHGIDNRIDAIRCKIKLTQFKLSLNQNKLEKMLVIVKLYQDLAGGYHGD